MGFLAKRDLGRESRLKRSILEYSTALYALNHWRDEI